MTDTILVTYATRAGSTEGVAEVIAQTLTAGGLNVAVQHMDQVFDVTPYAAVVAGSAIRSGKWLPEAMRFMTVHRKALQQRPFAAFMVCITLAMADAAEKHYDLTAWMEPVRALVPPVSEGYFAGALEFDKLPFFPEGLVMRIPAALGIFPQGDHRDWEAVRAWAQALPPKLVPTGVHA